MLTVGVDPNWQEDKLTRLMTAIQLVKQRRQQRKQEEEKKASRKMELILSAAEKNPSALTSDTVRQFVSQNSKLIPGLEEWYALETATQNDPNNPKSSYDKLLATADSYAGAMDQAAQGGAPGPFGSLFQMAGRFGANQMRQHPETAFDAAAASLKPSERLRAEQYAQKTGVEIPFSDPTLRNKKVDGSMYVLSNPDQFPQEVQDAARIQLRLKQPAKTPDERLNDYLYVIQNPTLFNPDVVKAARAHMQLEKPPTFEPKSPEDELSGVMKVLQNPGRYSPGVRAYADAELKNAKRNAQGEPPGHKEEKTKEDKGGVLTLNQADSSIDAYLADLYERHSGAGLKQLSLGQRRRAAQLLREGGDVDSFVMNAVLPVDGRSLKKVVNYYLRSSKRAEKGSSEKLEQSALSQIRAREKGGMSPEAARASVLNELLERAETDRSGN